MSNTSTEDQLVQRAKTGDRQAMGILLVLLEPTVRAFVRRRWPEYLFEADGVDDLVQRTHQSAWESMHQFRANDLREFKAWLFTVARNRMSFVVRHYAAERRRHNRVHLPDDSDTTAARLLERIARTTRSPGFRLRQAELLTMLRDGIGVLPEKQQTVLRLHFGEGLTFPQMAEQLEMTPAALRQIAHRAVRFLRTWLEADGDRESPDVRHGREDSAPPTGGPERTT